MNIFSEEYKEKRKIKKENWKCRKKEMKLERKAENKRKRELAKEKYADAPVFTKFVHVNAERIRLAFGIIVTLCVVGLLGYIFLAEPIVNMFMEEVFAHMDEVAKADFNPDEIYALSPLDEEGAARIAAIPGNNADDTWTFCVYMIGSNLEDMYENDLSSYVEMITSDAINENISLSGEARKERMDRYASEINANGLDVPEYLYKIYKPVASSVQVTDDVIVADEKGCASKDISEMCENALPENITIVIQTGGASRWSNSLVNPNKTQRFVIKNGIMSEVSNMHIQDTCKPDTLADFIDFCADNYESDHMAMILWDHGGGITGYGYDNIFKSAMSLADLNTAFSAVLTPNTEDPYFEIIGFDACLMAATDVAVSLDGYGKYLVASEEVEPGDGWDYTPWLTALANDTTMNAASVGREIADSYMNYYMKKNNDPLWKKLGGDSVVTFSVVDLHKAALVDAAYETMNEKFLKLIADDPSVLVDMTRAAKKTMRYAGADYDCYNTIDLGTYVDFLSEMYPEECAEVRSLLKDAVLYKRSYSYLDGSQGLSVYFPINMENTGSLSVFTEYVYNVSAKESTNALYFYKVAGCLNEDMQAYVSELTGKPFKTLNTQMFYDYQKIMPDLSDPDEIVINVGEELEGYIQDVYLELACYDESSNTITYYGTDDCFEYDGEGNIIVAVDGQWFALDGSLLDAKFSFATDTTTTYVTTVLHDGVPSYMTFTVNNETDDININSVIAIPNNHDVDYASSLKADTELRPGDTIVPILTGQDASGENTYDVEGDKVKYKNTSKIELVNLPDGDYVQSVVITDMRGDKYYSPVMEGTIKKGKVSSLEVAPEFVGSEN